MNPAIQVDKLSKRYSLGARSREEYRTLREAIVGATAAPWRRLQALAGRQGGCGTDRPEAFWALKDISFEVEPGEVVGVIGRNGAGKSTLLKILSRITEPTSGRAVLQGRVVSLLEVGTGFHQELTGRENIYLNGTILGMKRREIARKFDGIVDFAEIGDHLDTPVKRYSSGMYVRLAFAVASHLEAETLVIDEVLAVGDAAFQKKCLGKIGEVGRTGCTVLFVSHNMAAVRNLCRRVACLNRGRLDYLGDCEEGIAHYSSQCSTPGGGAVDLTDHPGRRSGSIPILRGIRLINSKGAVTDQFLSGESLMVEIDVAGIPSRRDYHFVLGVHDLYGDRLFTAATFLADSGTLAMHDRSKVVCHLDELPLAPGRYSVMLDAGPPPEKATDTIEQAAWFDVLSADFYGNGRMANPAGGRFLVRSRWEAR